MDYHEIHFCLFWVSAVAVLPRPPTYHDVDDNGEVWEPVILNQLVTSPTKVGFE